MSYRVPTMGTVDYEDPRSLRHLLTKNGTFPTGLLYIAIRYFKFNRLKVEIKDTRIAPKSFIGSFRASLGVVPHTWQQNAATAAYNAKRGCIQATTGTGKSLVIALLIEKVKVNTLVVVPSLEIKRQLEHMLSEAFGAKMVGKGRPIWVANIDSLDPKTEAKGYDCVIIDEFHHAAASTYRKLNKYAWRNIYYRFGLTATFFRSQPHERLLLEGVLSRKVYELDYQTAVKNKYIVPMQAYYVELPKRAVEGYTWAQVYKELIVENDARNNRITGLLRALEDAKKSALCLVKEIEHGVRLGFPFANGQDEESKELIKEFNNRDIYPLVGTQGILGEGVDTKPCEYVILTGLGKSKNALMQAFGRGFRNYPGKEICTIILFNDPSHKFTRSHFREQCKVLKQEYGCIPVKIG